MVLCQSHACKPKIQMNCSDSLEENEQKVLRAKKAMRISKDLCGLQGLAGMGGWGEKMPKDANYAQSTVLGNIHAICAVLRNTLWLESWY